MTPPGSYARSRNLWYTRSHQDSNNPRESVGRTPDPALYSVQAMGSNRAIRPTLLALKAKAAGRKPGVTVELEADARASCRMASAKPEAARQTGVSFGRSWTAADTTWSGQTDKSRLWVRISARPSVFQSPQAGNGSAGNAEDPQESGVA